MCFLQRGINSVYLFLLFYLAVFHDKIYYKLSRNHKKNINFFFMLFLPSSAFQFNFFSCFYFSAQSIIIFFGFSIFILCYFGVSFFFYMKGIFLVGGIYIILHEIAMRKILNIIVKVFIFCLSAEHNSFS